MNHKEFHEEYYQLLDKYELTESILCYGFHEGDARDQAHMLLDCDMGFALVIRDNLNKTISKKEKEH